MGWLDSQGGNTEADDAATEAIAQLIQKVQPGTMATRFILVVESIDQDGERCISSFTSLGLKKWESMGMLDFALRCEKEDIVLGHGHDDDDGDGD